jgi:hypothetical protein
MPTPFDGRIQQRRGTLANWETDNVILGSGEIVVIQQPVTLLPIGIKIGDGVSHFIDLPKLYLIYGTGELGKIVGFDMAGLPVPIPMPPVSLPAYGKVLYVDISAGNNGTAVKGRIDRPYQSLTAAKAAAVSGDLIIVFPGTFDEYDLLKNGVNWYFHEGALVQPTGNQSIFTDGSQPAGCTSKILGRGEFLSYDVQGNNACTVAVLKNGTNLEIEAKRVAGFHTWDCTSNIVFRGVEFTWQTAPQSGATVTFENCFFNNSSNGAEPSHGYTLNVTYRNCRFKRLASLPPGMTDNFTSENSALKFGNGDSSSIILSSKFYMQLLHCQFDCASLGCLERSYFNQSRQNTVLMQNCVFQNTHATGKLIIPTDTIWDSQDRGNYYLNDNISNKGIDAGCYPITNLLPGSGFYIDSNFKIS